MKARKVDIERVHDRSEVLGFGTGVNAAALFVRTVDLELVECDLRHCLYAMVQVEHISLEIKYWALKTLVNK